MDGAARKGRAHFVMKIAPHTIIVTAAALVLLVVSVSGHAAYALDGDYSPIPAEGNLAPAAPPRMAWNTSRC